MSGTFELYMEIVEAMGRAGVVFAPDTFHDLIESLDNGQHYLQRDAEGRIVTFCNYWMVDDPLAVLQGKPESVSGGSFLFVVDHFNTAGRGAYVALSKALRRKEGQFRGAAWFHKRRRAESLRVFRKQRGEQ